VVEEVLRLLRKVGVTVEAVDVPPTALWRLAEFLLDGAASGPTAIVDIGSAQTTAVITDGRALSCCRRISFGGAGLTAAIQKALEVPEEDAELIKRRQGCTTGPATGDEGDSAQKVDRILKDILRSPLQQLAQQIERLLRYFATQAKGKKVVRLLLAGGCSKFPPLKATIAQATGVEVVTLDELDEPARVRLAPPNSAADLHLGLFAVAAGLALRDGTTSAGATL